MSPAHRRVAAAPVATLRHPLIALPPVKTDLPRARTAQAPWFDGLPLHQPARLFRQSGNRPFGPAERSAAGSFVRKARSIPNT